MRKRHCLLGAAFVLTSTGALLSVLLMTPAVGMESLLQPHFSAATYKASTPMAPSELVQRLFKANPALFITTAVGLPLLAIRKITEGRMPIVFLGTISIAHLIHRPFWSYYDLHFALPMAWISALAVYELVGIALRIKWQMRPFPWAGLSAYLGFSICLSLILTEIIVQGKTVASQLSMHGHLREGVGVTGLVRNPETVGLVYVDNMEAFHAGLAVVPELAVLSNKRRRAGLISPAQIEAIIRDRRPDLIQSARLSAPSASMKAWLAKHYRHSEGHSEFLVPVVN